MDRTKVIIEDRQKAVKIPTGIRLLIRRCCNAVLQMEQIPGSCEVCVSFVDTEEIRQLNARFRNRDEVTDVLSFPLGIDGNYDVNPATGEFNFAVDEGYVIRNGKVCEPVRGATLIGKGHEIMPRISMVGTDFEQAAGVCGASSGHVPVTVGQPSIKVDQILVGGR